MALNATKTGKKIAKILTASNASPEIAKQIEDMWINVIDALYADVKADLEVTVPSGSVIIAVAGQATGTPNTNPIRNGVQ